MLRPGNFFVVTKSRLRRQAAFLFKLSKTAADPELAATLVKTAADLKDAADSLDGDTDIETQTKKAK